MTIHHAQIKQAEQLGFMLTEVDNGMVQAKHPSTGTVIFGVSAKDAIKQMTAYLNILNYNSDIRYTALDDPRTIGYLRHEGEVSEQGTPVELHRRLGKDLQWVKPDNLIVDNIVDTFDAPPPDVVDPTPVIKLSLIHI